MVKILDSLRRSEEKRYLPPRPKTVRNSVNTQMKPMPPSQPVRDLQRSIEPGMDSRSSMHVMPVVVNPLTDSNTASMGARP